MNYGIPYKGSKNSLCGRIAQLLPPADTFIDVFGGGCSITQAAMATKKYKTHIVNDIDEMPLNLFVGAVKGAYNNNTSWVSKSEFDEKKRSDPYIRYCWSFGSNGRDYMYSKDIEEWKKALHYLVINCDATLMDKFGVNADVSIEDIKRNNAHYQSLYSNWLQTSTNSKRGISEETNMLRLQHIERRERVLELCNCVDLERLSVSSVDYRDLYIPSNSVVYCDPPYNKTNGYGLKNRKFDNEAFYDWACSLNADVFISEYDMPRDRFEPIEEFTHNQSICRLYGSKRVTERLFVPKGQKNKGYNQLKLF